MLNRDIRTFVELGQALWVDPERVQPVAVETLSAVALLDLPEDRVVERAASAMLERAIGQGASSAPGSFRQPFFRLFPAERFLLVALHLGRWSYARLGRVMKVSAEDVQAAAWKARVRLGSERGHVAIGAKLASASCPEYDLDRPWTQRFLDEEIQTGQERLFLQNHLMVCDSCRQALNRCRDLYYAVDQMLPRLSESAETLAASLTAIQKRGRRMTTPPTNATFGQSLVALFSQSDFQFLLGVVVTALIARLFLN